jgi:hypothetical protein
LNQEKTINPLKNKKMETFKETTAYERASKRVKDLKEFYGNLTSFCIVIPFLAF